MSEQRPIDAFTVQRLLYMSFNSCGLDGFSLGYKKALGLAIKTIENAPTIDPVRNGEWISVKDRLPEGTGNYLIIYSREICRPEMAVAFFSAEDAEDCPYDKNYGFEYTTYGDHKDVLYWMHLPEMPMEENDKE